MISDEMVECAANAIEPIIEFSSAVGRSLALDVARAALEAAERAAWRIQLDQMKADDVAALTPYFEERLARIRANWRVVVEDLAFQFGFQDNDKKRKWIATGGLSALEGAFEALGWDDPHYVKEGGCEHPGCKAWDTCGTPTTDGYKRLCGEHYRAVRPLPSPPGEGA